MDAFLAEAKAVARRRSWRWQLSCLGSREATFRRFRTAVDRGEADLIFLLVDAEAAVTQPVLEHLAARDHWALGFASEDRVHLMVQTMETWIVADPNAVEAYYGPSFRSVLPTTVNLERVPKRDVERALARATENTTKGTYHKIRHASALLALLDAERVCVRCASCDRFLRKLDEVLSGGD